MSRQGDQAIAMQHDVWPTDPGPGSEYQVAHSHRAGEALEANELVMVDVADTTGFAGYTVIAATTNLGHRVMGVTDVAYADGDIDVKVLTGRVQVQCDAGVAAGDPLQVSATAGQVVAGVEGTDHIVGCAITAASGGLCWAYIYQRR